MRRIRAPRPRLLLLLVAAVLIGGGAWAERAGAVEPAAQGGEAQVIGPLWQWQGTLLSDETSFTPTDPSRYTIEFTPEGRVNVRADCNRGSGRYWISENRIVFGAIATTLIGCPPGSLDTPFLRQLNDVVSFFIRDGDLFMEIKSDSGTMRFSRAEAAAGRSAAVTGSVTYRERIALLPDAVVTVQLQDTSRADAPAVVIGEQVIPTMGRQVPIPFSISYDPATVDQRNRYTLAARIEDGAGRLLWVTMQAYPVITAGNPTSDIEVVVQMVR